MTTEAYWIEGPWPGRLAIVPRPRGGDWLKDEVSSWRQAKFDAVVSLLTLDEIGELDLTREKEICSAQGIDLLWFSMPDRDVPPSQRAFLDFAKKVEALLASGKNVAVHCRQGIGRSSLLTASLLVLSGVDPESALNRISAARGCAVPDTVEQKEWVIEFARKFAPVVETRR